jgi:hypothetical protein
MPNSAVTIPKRAVTMDRNTHEVAAGTVAAVPLHEALGRLEGRFRG